MIVTLRVTTAAAPNKKRRYGVESRQNESDGSDWRRLALVADRRD
eukprot:CAMPEP_0194309710 /NCGR_PEP_ID=MMETSP0171-20130528/6684_1 /TAXON_ID=218684 /ORGANISM="Corethron pennatum, Strain L29A3" /LENGTH=44 /DNA_ID= /DNA_START= /DNA_END= /DNA_ORIENTATION=